jgi:hypothetical protein
MHSSITFIAFLFCMGLAGLVSGGISLYEWIDFHYNGRPAMMQLADPGRKVTLPAPGGADLHPMDVKYSGADGDVVVPQKRLSMAMARRLANGEKIPVTYMKHNPNRVYFAGEMPDSPWGWLGLGALTMGFFVWAWKLKRREAED